MIGWIGPCEKYHNILKIVVWVVRHVNLTFLLPFVPDLHVQCGSLCRKLAYSAYLRANVQRWPKHTLLLLCFYTFRSSATREVSWKISLIRDNATGSSASLLYVLWIIFFKTGYCTCSSCKERQVYMRLYPSVNLRILWYLIRTSLGDSSQYCFFIPLSPFKTLKRRLLAEKKKKKSFALVIPQRQFALTSWILANKQFSSCSFRLLHPNPITS